MSLTEVSLQKVATSFLSAFQGLDITTHISLRSPNCTHIFLPQSLHISPKSNDAFAAHFTKNLVPYLSSFPVTPQEIHVNVAKRQVTIWATAVPYFKSEAMGKEPVEEEWRYMGEYIFILDVDESGKIQRILEFLDSKETERFRELFKKARESLGETGIGF